MAPDEVRAFLSDGTRTAKLATVSTDGRPHVVPVWFVLDGDDVVFTTHEGSQKGRALRCDPRVACCVDDDHPTYSYVMVSGTATISTDLDDLVRWATRIDHRRDGPGRVVRRCTRGHDGRPGGAHRRGRRHRDGT